MFSGFDHTLTLFAPGVVVYRQHMPWVRATLVLQRATGLIREWGFGIRQWQATPQ